MNDYIDWDRGMVDYSDDVLGLSKAEWREKLASDTQAYLDAGNEITILPYDWTTEIAARVGYWQGQGQTELDEMLETIETDVY